MAPLLLLLDSHHNLSSRGGNDMTEDRYTRNRCAIVLAGGDGTRLKPFIRELKGVNALPKQYCNVIGSRSMLEHTFDRAERLIDPERIFTVVRQEHLPYP